MDLKNHVKNANKKYEVKTMKNNKFCELTKQEMMKIEGGKNVFYKIGYYVGRVLHYYSEGVSHLHG